MSNNPLFSVLIANYNNGHYIQETLESIYNQDYQNREIIIVDDCSTDNSKNIYKTLENNPKIKIYYNSENKGCGYTKRRCAEMAMGEICGFLDPDDVLTPDALRLMVEKHIEMPEVSLVHARAIYCDEDMNEMDTVGPSRQVEWGKPSFFNLEASISHFSTFKAAYYRKTEGIDAYLQRAVDQDLYLKLYESGKTHFLDKFLYKYRIHKSGISTVKNIEKAYYWHWVVITNAARRRNLIVEELFCDHFIRKELFNKLEKNYLRLRKYEKFNNFLAKTRKKLGLA